MGWGMPLWNPVSSEVPGSLSQTPCYFSFGDREEPVTGEDRPFSLPEWQEPHLGLRASTAFGEEVG